MIRQLLAASIVIASVNAFAKKERAPWAHYELNFKHGTVMEESHLGMCDDSYFGGFTVSLPGRQGVEFNVKKISLESGCTLQGSKQESVKGFLRTIYFISGSCDGQIDFESTKGHDKALMEIHDAC